MNKLSAISDIETGPLRQLAAIIVNKSRADSLQTCGNVGPEMTLAFYL